MDAAGVGGWWWTDKGGLQAWTGGMDGLGVEPSRIGYGCEKVETWWNLMEN